MARVRRGNVFASGQQRADSPAKRRLATHRDGIERGAVEGIPHRDEFEPSCRDARQLERHADGGSAAGRKEDAIQVAGGQLGQLPGQGHSRFAGVASGAKGEPVELFLYRGDDPRMPEADLVNIIAVKIEIAAAGNILDPRAPAGA